MFCSRCGKKLNEDMLFCPFCGASVVIPAQDAVQPTEPQAVEEAAVQPVIKSTIPVRRGNSASSVFSRQTVALHKPAEPVFPKREKKLSEPEQPKASAADKTDTSVYDIEEESFKPVVSEKPDMDDFDNETEGHFKWSIPKMPSLRKRKLPEVDEENEDDNDEYDKFDLTNIVRAKRKYHKRIYDEADSDDDEDDIIETSDNEEESFITRHLRSLIGALLLLVLLMLLLIWVFSNSGQNALARANLAWKPDAYSRIGYENYQASNYISAGKYYEQALKKSPDSYEYATSAAMAYIAALDDSSTERMLKEAIRIRPAAAEPYLCLMNMYPDPATRPDEIAQLLMQGYQITADERLASAA